MDKNSIMTTALKYLPLQGITIREFAKRIHICPHTIYNYISGQKPANKTERYIMLMLEKEYPQTIELAKEILKEGEKKNGSVY